MPLDSFVKGTEYYFYFKEYYLTGFVNSADEKYVFIENGHFYNTTSGAAMHGYSKGVIKMDELIGFATT